ncbi:hypothetical protein FIBSPDRAFT_125832 [Athelia psychrophila]|uniref:Uncharacterized protein n=1 Tax=Athelia psychrophila TaxID=1759441 RepID=A0A166T768_9AGAM|nr:hypothetical protein FIBSPDRAFT_125832 [Fibularhizoctonia sp. CBS 109695]
MHVPCQILPQSLVLLCLLMDSKLLPFVMHNAHLLAYNLTYIFRWTLTQPWIELWAQYWLPSSFTLQAYLPCLLQDIFTLFFVFVIGIIRATPFVFRIIRAALFVFRFIGAALGVFISIEAALFVCAQYLFSCISASV